MFYFKKIVITNYSSQQLEAALRKASLKRTSSWDLDGSTNIGTKMLFVGYESKDGLFFTRIKYFIEKYLPKLIIKLSPDKYECSYCIKFSLISTLVFTGFALLTLISLWAIIRNPSNAAEFLPLLFIVGIYFLLILLEFKLTNAKIYKALRAYNEQGSVPSA